MKEGAWISGVTAQWFWVHDHALWVTRPWNARLLGVSDDIQRLLVALPPPHTPTERREVLLMAMDAGLIRARWHGASITFEFTCAWTTALSSVMPFLEVVGGPWLGLTFNHVGNGESIGVLNRDLEAQLTPHAVSGSFAEQLGRLVGRVGFPS